MIKIGMALNKSTCGAAVRAAKLSKVQEACVGRGGMTGKDRDRPIILSTPTEKLFTEPTSNILSVSDSDVTLTIAGGFARLHGFFMLPTTLSGPRIFFVAEFLTKGAECTELSGR